MGATETKMLYTLHWILLFAAEECADADMESSKDLKKNSQHYLFSVPTISVSYSCNLESSIFYNLFVLGFCIFICSIGTSHEGI